MSITIGEYVFEGPYSTTEELMNDPGVFAVIVAKFDKGSLIDIGESNKVRKYVEDHPSKSRWKKFECAGALCYAVLYTPDFDRAERRSIERSIRAQYENNASGRETGKGDKRK